MAPFQLVGYAAAAFLFFPCSMQGYLLDGTPLNMAGNNINHPENIGPDPHVPGSPLPRAIFTNSIGYLPDGTPMNMAGNAINHPENIQPDVHAPGSPLPSSYYYADVGYLVDGTDLISAGNNSVKAQLALCGQTINGNEMLLGRACSV